MEVLYRAHAVATGGGREDGHVRTDDGKVDVRLSTPREMGGSGGEGTNPEQLFAAGYAACFLGALRLVAGQAGKPAAPETEVRATVGFGRNDRGEGFNLDIGLEVANHGLPAGDFERILARAHQVCPYSNATRGNVEVRLRGV